MLKNMTDDTLDLMAGRFKVLSEPMRLKILHTLHSKEMHVQQIVEATGANQANVSKHLAIMLEAGMLKRRKEGLNSFYSIADDSIFKLCELVCGSIEKNLRKSLNSLKL
jgi:ArsR family transcriptional regulator